jgi:hypothetical protein
VEREADFAVLPRVPATVRAKPTPYSPGTGDGWQGWLKRIGDDRDGFHEPIRSAVMAAAGIEPDTLKTAIRSAITSAAKAPGRDVHRYLSDSYLSASIAGAENRRRESYIQPQGAISAASRLSLPQAETRVSDALRAFLTDRQSACLAVPPGVGKTSAALKAIAEHIDLNKERLLFTAPTNALARELHLATPGSRRWMGRYETKAGKIIPRLNDDGEQMCHPDMVAQVAAFERAGLPGTTLCGT